MESKRRRKRTRLDGYDYSRAGDYFITICKQNRFEYFGEIQNEEMKLSRIGIIANQCWLELPNHFPNVKLDEYIVMPNHIHGIIVVNQKSRRRGTACRARTPEIFGKHVLPDQFRQLSVHLNPLPPNVSMNIATRQGDTCVNGIITIALFITMIIEVNYANNTVKIN